MNTENDWNQCDIIKKIRHYKTNTKQPKGPWHVFVQTEYQNTSTLILTHRNTWAAVNKTHGFTYLKWHNTLFEPLL